MHTGRLYIQLLIVLLGIAVKGYTQVTFDCRAPLDLGGCNHIPNPQFNVIDPSSNARWDAFYRGNVPNWGPVYCTTADINGIGTNTPPPALPANLTGVNYAGMLAFNSSTPATGPSNFEGIAAKIRAVKAGEEYGFSFFACNKIFDSYHTGLAANYKLRVVLAKCFNVGAVNCSGPTYPWVPVLQQKQEIFCAQYDNVNDNNWNQYFVSFTAQDDWDMILIYTEPYTTVPNRACSFAYVAMPELIPLNPVATQPGANCLRTLSMCTVTNALFEWTDPNGKVISNATSVTINGSKLPGDYKVQVKVPAVVTNNSCSNNNPLIEETFTVPPCSSCKNVLAKGKFTYRYNDGINYTGGPYTIDLLRDCNANTICHGIDEGGITLDMGSIYPTGNTWEIFRDGIPATDPAAHIGFWQSYPTNQQHYNPTFTFTHFNDPTTFEIRLTNSVAGQTDNLFVTLLPQVVFAPYVCWSQAHPGYVKVVGDVNYTLPSTTFNWIITNPPPSFSMITPNPNLPVLEYRMNASEPPFDILLRITNSQYVCDKVERITLWAEAPNCHWRQAMQDEVSTSTVVYPNPVTSTFSIKSAKRIERIHLYSADGRLLKRFLAPDIHRPYQIHDLSAGVYWIRITYADHSTETKRIVKPNTNN